MFLWLGSSCRFCFFFCCLLLFYFVISSSKSSNIFERRDTSSRDVEGEKVATIVKPESVFMCVRAWVCVCVCMYVCMRVKEFEETFCRDRDRKRA